VIARRRFLALATAAAAIPLRAKASDQYDPASQASSPELRVLLGAGSAEPLPGGGFTFGGRAYRGVYETDSNGIVVNTVKLEDYLYSVVTREMTSSWPAAALQAQAVCARTYVLERSNPRRAYDLVPSELDQVYDGTVTETAAGRNAVDATTGAVLRFGDAFATVMYASCCGGRTESVNDAWGGAPIGYLSGVACTTCTASPYYRWTRSLTLATVEQVFSLELAGLGPLRTIAISGTDASGRARAIALQTATGVAYVKGTSFRLRVGARALPSLLISRIGNPDSATGQLLIEGGGLGHGVGLCQWGARGLALQGASFQDILKSYFPGTETEHD
jgi:stage II sporulation protein D